MKSSLFVFSLTLLLSTRSGIAVTKNGFDLTDSAIPAHKIEQGGPPRDGIPSIDRPRFVAAQQADFLKSKHRVIGVYLDGIAKAYPIGVLNWHEIVNDHLNGVPVVVTFCPLCNTGMVFRAPRAGDERLRFGVSGLLYNSDVLLYDRQTESLWSQLLAKAISGPNKDQHLELLVSSHTTWRDWVNRHPDTLVLSTDTGYQRDYGQSPYLGYARSEQLFFDVEYRNRVHRNKELVLGISFGDQHKAYPFRELNRFGQVQFEDRFAGQTFTVAWSKKDDTASVFDRGGKEIPTVIAYWFAWYSFHPETEVFDASSRQTAAR